MKKSYQLTTNKSSNKLWTCDGLFAEGDNKVRDHYHLTGKYRASVY